MAVREMEEAEDNVKEEPKRQQTQEELRETLAEAGGAGRHGGLGTMPEELPSLMEEFIKRINEYERMHFWLLTKVREAHKQGFDMCRLKSVVKTVLGSLL